MPLLDKQFISDSIFNDLSPKQINDLNDCAKLEVYKPGDTIFQRGKDANRFFIIKSGKVNIEIYTPELGAKPIQTIGTGDLLGTSWLSPQPKWKMDARAVTDVELICFNAYRVMDKCAVDKDLGYALMSRFLVSISQRLDASQKQILTLVQELTNK